MSSNEYENLSIRELLGAVEGIRLAERRLYQEIAEYDVVLLEKERRFWQLMARVWPLSSGVAIVAVICFGVLLLTYPFNLILLAVVVGGVLILFMIIRGGPPGGGTRTNGPDPSGPPGGSPDVNDRSLEGRETQQLPPPADMDKVPWARPAYEEVSKPNTPSREKHRRVDDPRER